MTSIIFATETERSLITHEKEGTDTSELYKLFLKHPVVTTDSCDCPKGSMFLALKGTSFNGNEFAQSALEKGYAYAVIGQKEYQIQENERYISVEDCLQTLKQLASYRHRTLNMPIIGVTGTNGRTTAKELLAIVLAKRFNMWYTQGNFDNEIGVPRTLLCSKSEHEMVVVETDTNHPGDIQSLVIVTEPGYALITNVGRTHLQGFGSFEGVMRTKTELYDYMQQHKPQGLVFISQDNEYLKEMFRTHCPNVKAMEYVQTDRPNISIRGEVVSCVFYLKSRQRKTATAPSPREDIRWHEVRTQLIGAYSLNNTLAAITIGSHFGVSDEQINHALAGYMPSNNRSQLQITARNKLIVNAYNANPTSMETTLTNPQRADMPRKMTILGDIRELGDMGMAEHQKIVDLVATLNLDKVWLVGGGFGRTNTTLRKSKDMEAVREALRQKPPRGYYVLIKGSDNIKLFQLPKLL